jgi:KDEL-tailed cysteine endopeptidase
VTANSVSDLQTAAAKQPVSVSLAASTNYFQTYSSGILSNATACGTTVDHAVLVVGYGYEATSNMNYWIVKNSWGTSWGQQGYVWIQAVDGEGVCAIQYGPLYPTL